MPDKRREIAAYVAQEAARRYGPIEDDLPRKLQRNIRRKHEVTVPLDELMLQARHFKAMYAYAASTPPAFLDPPRGRYVDASDVRMEPYVAAISAKYPDDDCEIIDVVVQYAVFYEYLK